MLTEPEADESEHPVSAGNGNDIIAIWIGLTVQNDTPSWTNNVHFDPDLSHFVATNWMDRSGCVMMSADHTAYDMVWLVARCSQRFRAVCEKEKSQKGKHIPKVKKNVGCLGCMKNTRDILEAYLFFL